MALKLRKTQMLALGAFALAMVHGLFALLGLVVGSRDMTVIALVFGGALLLVALVTYVIDLFWCAGSPPADSDDEESVLMFLELGGLLGVEGLVLFFLVAEYWPWVVGGGIVAGVAILLWAALSRKSAKTDEPQE
jgi:hypothetical protein